MKSDLANILNKCRENDERAQYQLYRDLFDTLMSICMRYEKNRDDAINLLNLGFFKILSNLDKYSDDRSFEGWVRRIMTNTVIDSYRKNKKRLETEMNTDFNEPVNQTSSTLSSEIDQYIEEEHLQNMLNQLPDATKAVFNLYAIDGYTHKEIGQQLGISAGTSKWHVSQARATLKKLLVKFQQGILSVML